MELTDIIINKTKYFITDRTLNYHENYKNTTFAYSRYVLKKANTVKILIHNHDLDTYTLFGKMCGRKTMTVPERVLFVS